MLGLIPGHPLDERVVRLLVPSLGQMRYVSCDSFSVQSSALILVGFGHPKAARSTPGASREVQEQPGDPRERPGKAQKWSRRVAEKVGKLSLRMRLAASEGR